MATYQFTQQIFKLRADILNMFNGLNMTNDQNFLNICLMGIQQLDQSDPRDGDFGRKIATADNFIITYLTRFQSINMMNCKDPFEWRLNFIKQMSESIVKLLKSEYQTSFNEFTKNIIKFIDGLIYAKNESVKNNPRTKMIGSGISIIDTLTKCIIMFVQGCICDNQCRGNNEILIVYELMNTYYRNSINNIKIYDNNNDDYSLITIIKDLYVIMSMITLRNENFGDYGKFFAIAKNELPQICYELVFATN